MKKTDMSSTVKTRRQFNEAFKLEALKHWQASGKSAGVVAKELGLLPNRLYAWQKRYAPATVQGQPATINELQAQLAAAQREIRHLTQQRDILKKTLGILSEPLPNVLNGSKP
jgi:transposase-like protein